MKTLFLLGLAALAVATSKIPQPQSLWLEEIVKDRTVKETTFVSGVQYDYLYEGQLLTGLPQSSKQHSATRVQAVCSLVFTSENQCLLKLRQIRMGKLNKRVSEPRRIVPFSSFEEVSIESEHLQLLTTPVKFTYERGLIGNIEFDETEKPWSANMKRGVLNLLQVNLGQQGRTDRVDDARTRNELEAEDPQNDFFTAIEKTLEGECETDYSVTSRPRYSQQVLNVTKSINFEKCRRRPEIKYNYRFTTPCPTCEKKYSSQEKMLQSSTVNNLQISGNTRQFMIEKSESESQYIYKPTSEQANIMTSYVSQTLVLMRTKKGSSIQEPRNPQASDSQMLYTPDWDVLKERFFKEGEEQFHGKTPYSAISNKLEFIEPILRKMVRCVGESVEECAPRQFTRLVKVLRMCKPTDLNKIHQKFYKQTPSSFTPEDHKKIKDLLVDAIAVAGTKDCVDHLVSKIKNRDVHPIKAALTIKNLINVRVPSKEMLDKLEQLAQHDVCQRNLFLKQSVYLTYGSLVHALCGNHEDKLAVHIKTQAERRCSRTLKQELVDKMFEKFYSRETTPEKILLLKTIGNAGLDLSAFKLEKIIKNTGSQGPYNNMIRVEAVLALRRLRGTMPRKIQKMLMPIVLKQRQERPELRMVCVYQIMETLPERSVIDQLTQQMYRERSRQVRSFIYTHFRTLANSTNPCEKRVADDLKLSLRRARSMPAGRLSSYSKYIQMRSYSKKLDQDLGLNLGVVMNNQSPFPSVVTAGLNVNSHSQWFKNFLTVGVVQKGVEQWIRQIYRKDGPIESGFDETVHRRSPRSIKTQSPMNDMKSLFQKLKITNRYTQDENPTVMPYLKFKDQDLGFLPISPESIPESVREIIRNDRLNLDSIERVLEQGIQMNFYQAFMLHEQSRKIPTTLGLPVRLSVKLPVVMRLSGQIKGKFEPKNKLRLARLEFNVKPSIASTMSAKMESWSPIVNNGLKVIGNLKVFIPINCMTELDARKSPVQTKLVCEPHRNPYELIKAQTKPISYTYEWPQSLTTWQEAEERTIVGEEWNRVRTWNSEMGEKSLGINFKVRGSWHRTPKQSVTGTPFCPFSGPNKFQVIVEPGHQMPKEVIVRMTGKVFNQLKKSLKPDFDIDEQSREFFDSYGSQSSSEESSEEYQPSYKNYESSQSVNNQFHIKVQTAGSSIKRTAELKFNCHNGQQERHMRCVLDIKRSPIPQRESNPWNMRVETETFYPETPYRFSELSENKRFTSQIQAVWGQEGDQKKEVDIKVQGKQSRKQFEQLRKDRIYYNSECSSPICQYDLLKRASVLTDYRVDVDYKLGHQEKNVTNKWYRYLKNWYYQQTDVNQINVNNPDNQIRMHITIDPKSLQTVNVTIKVPRETAKIKDIPLRRPIRPINIRYSSSRVRSFTDLVQKYLEPTMCQCQIRPRSVRTFDGVRMSLPFSQCYSVLAKDCSRPENPRFAVLTKKVDGDSIRKQMKIISRQNRVILRLKDGEIETEINGNTKQCPDYEELTHHEHVVLRIQKQGPYCKVSLPEAGIKVYFDGVAGNIKMSQMYSSWQCGLCGHYNGDESDDLQTPEMQLVELPQFVRSWLVNEQCQVEDEMNDDSQYFLSDLYNDRDQVYEPDWRRSTKTGSCPYPRDMSYVDGSECSGDEQCDGKQKCCFNGYSHTCVKPVERRGGNRGHRQPVRRTKVVEHSHELCFSKQPTSECPTDSYPLKHQMEQKVVYACLPRSDPQAEVLHDRALRRQIVEEVSALPSSFVQKEAIPELCVQY